MAALAPRVSSLKGGCMHMDMTFTLLLSAPQDVLDSHLNVVLHSKHHKAAHKDYHIPAARKAP